MRGRSRRGGRARPSGRLFRGMAEGGAQLGQREWLVQVGPAERFEKLERVAAHRVAGGEDDPFGHPRVLAGELGVHLAPGEVRHPQVADDHVERTRQGALERVGAVARHLDGVDRKSTRLNSSHTVISYAVFCLKKKKEY